MKTYNIIEVLNMPVGTEFEVESDKDKDKVVVKKNNHGYTGLYHNSLDDFIRLTKDNVNLKFVKIRKPLTFFEAMKLVDKGKKATNNRIIGNGYYFKNESGELEYHVCENIYLSGISNEEINAEWYEYED